MLSVVCDPVDKGTLFYNFRGKSGFGVRYAGGGPIGTSAASALCTIEHIPRTFFMHFYEHLSRVDVR
jgi:hypothetical protein